MKKIFSSILALCMVLFMFGCNQSTPADTATSPTTEPAASVEPVTLDVPFLAVGLPVEETRTTADDGTLIFALSSPYMTLTIDGQVTADLIIHDFMDKINAAKVSAESVEADAKTAFAYSGTANWNPFLFSIECAPTRIDTNTLSIYGVISSYTGGSHPLYTCFSTNYNLITGDPLTLGSILTHEDSISDLCDLLIAKLEMQKDEKQLREGYENDIKERFAMDVSFDDAWYFSDTGLCFYFPHYEIAPYSSGIITAEIPYSELTGIIDDAFFPPEYSIENGNAKIVPYSEDHASSYRQTSELILDREGKKYFIEADSSILNIRIVRLDEDVETAEHYCAYCLNPGNAIMVQIPDAGAGTYCVAYEQNGNTVTVPIK